MTIKMRLDTEGLRALIADNPELEVEIGKEVLNNIRMDVVHLKVDEVVQKLLWGKVENTGTYYSPNYKIKDAKLLKVIDDLVEKAARDKLESAVSQAVTAAIAAQMNLVRADVRAELITSMRALLTPAMAQELMKEKLFG